MDGWQWQISQINLINIIKGAILEWKEKKE
jgi:hypothetical protein